jgi:arylsulfatase I/J
MHVNQENSATEQALSGIPYNMTTFPSKLKTLGYKTAQVGKWHCGQATARHIPHGRGFDTSLGYFNFGEDHYTQIRGGQAASETQTETSAARGPPAPYTDCIGVDLWKTDAPAYHTNGTYGGYIYRDEALRVINSHTPDVPLFMFLAWQNNHPPLQVPPSYVARQRTTALRTMINGMTTFLDDAIGNVTAALKAKGMWDDTLLVFSGDNGGYLGQGGDNTPFRGGKFRCEFVKERFTGLLVHWLPSGLSLASQWASQLATHWIPTGFTRGPSGRSP